MSSGVGQLDKAVLMEKQQQDSNVSRLSLDQCFSDKGRRSSARLCHQSLDRGMDRPSLDQRFGGTGQQLPMTAPHCRWTQASSVDQQPLDQRFGDSDYRLSATGLHHLKAAVEQQDNNMGLQLPMTATMSSGQQTMELPAASVQGCNGYQLTSSHSKRTSTNVDGWTSDEIQHSSIYASAGAQLRNTDKASRTDMNWKSATHDIQASTSGDIGSTESRLATLGWSLDFNEADRPTSLNVDSFQQRSSPPAASAKGESSAGYPRTEGPGGRKRVDVNLQVDLDSCSIEEELVTCQTDPPHRFTTASARAVFASLSTFFRQ